MCLITAPLLKTYAVSIKLYSIFPNVTRGRRLYVVCNVRIGGVTGDCSVLRDALVKIGFLPYTVIRYETSTSYRYAASVS